MGEPVDPLEEAIVPAGEFTPEFTPERDHYPETHFPDTSPEPEQSPDMNRSPPRSWSPPAPYHSPTRGRSPERTWSPDTDQSPVQDLSPDRSPTPERNNSPYHQPTTNSIPFSTHSPQRDHSPYRDQTPARVAPPEQSPLGDHSPYEEYSPERNSSPIKDSHPQNPGNHTADPKPHSVHRKPSNLKDQGRPDQQRHPDDEATLSARSHEGGTLSARSMTPGMAALAPGDTGDDKHSNRNTALSYRSDRTRHTTDPESRAIARKKYRSALTHLLCGLYALGIIVIGLVFTISSNLTMEERRDSLYLQVFLLYIYAMSLFFLVYLHCVLLRKRKSRDTSSVHRINIVSNNQVHDPHEKCSVDYAMFASPDTDADATSNLSRDKRSGSRSHTEFEEGLDSLSADFESVSFDAHGVNFYLRLGLIAFGTGSMLHDGFKIASLFVDGKFSLECRSALYVAVAVIHMVFTFFQTYFLFKSHKIVVNKTKAFVRFGFVHMVATNLCVWIAIIVAETGEVIRNTSSHDLHKRASGSYDEPAVNSYPDNYTSTHDNHTVESGHDECQEIFENSLAVVATPYLFPCTIEYSLLASALLYRMYENVGCVAKHSFTHSEHQGQGRMDCHKANKGFFMGLIITVITLISVSCFFVFKDEVIGAPAGGLIFFANELLLLLLCFVVVIVGFTRLQKLRFAPDTTESQLDIILLIVSLFGIYVFNIFIIISSVTHVLPFDLMSCLALATSTLAIIESTLQTIFIMDGLRRYADSEHQVHSKPGRAVITFLLLCNLSLWITSTFETSKASHIPTYQEYYGVLAWAILSHICIPLLIFYRFHSTVCLSDIWINAYKLKKKEL